MPKLTVERLKRLKYPECGPPGRRVVLWDTELPGFGIRVYPGGRKAYVVSYRHRRRKRLMVIGSATVLSLPEARDRAKKALVAVTDGIDPLAHREADRDAMTFGKLADRYLARAEKKGKRSIAEDRRRIDKQLKPWRGHVVASLTRRDVESLHNRIGATAPYEANRTLALLKAMFRLARQQGHVPADWLLPTEGVAMFPEEKRDRYLRPAEVERLADAIAEETNPHVRGVLWLLFYTGCRKKEALNAQWEHIETDAEGRRTLVLPKTKSGRVHRVPLSAQALALLDELPRVEGNPYIFPGKRRGRPLVNISKPWDRIRERANLPDVRMHDLRRTVGSWLSQSGKDLHLIGSVLNHSDPKVTQVYAHFEDTQVREALESVGKQIEGAAKGDQGATVTPIRKQ